MMKKTSKELDYVLVPMGMAVMVAYHAWLLLRIRRRPATTVIGINAINRRIWVRHVMEEASGKHAVLAVQTMRNSIMASTVLASVAITLSSSSPRSWPAALPTASSPPAPATARARSSSAPAARRRCRSSSSPSSSASSSPSSSTSSPSATTATPASSSTVPLHAHRHRRRRPGLAVDYVTATLNRGSYFWSLGVRAFYFSCPVFLWLFGPIPMFASCLAMVCALYFLDVYTEWDEKPEEEEELNGNGDGDDGGAAACHEQPKMAAGNRVTPQQDVV
ncbi:hypothetical protein OsJ_26068 [Oryza sativa Japonica Group]|uniref:Uncharacterized protein n=1 Tax=Oryza sativa subsp. japonica TaxID=39947 RepID=A3BPQ4_ORYSJ|nr:hypothetical protein OsJ_26068 [Oryza sativa Japonica Group]